MAKVPKSTLPTKSEEEITELARGMVQGTIFTSLQTPADLMTLVFMPLAMLDRKARLDMQRKARPGILYADMKDAGPRGINGYPMFFAFGMLHEEDTERLLDKYNKMVEALA